MTNENSTAKYTYTIFDANPHTSSGTAWPSHDDIEIDAESDEEALDAVRDVMSTEAAGLNAEDGYAVGDTLHAIVWAEDGTIVGQPTYEITAEDMGVEERMTMAEAREWALSAEEGDYLVEYEDDGMDAESDPGSRCGFGDDELAEIEQLLGERGLKLTADDVGLVAESR